jgi:hypothetical protein
MYIQHTSSKPLSKRGAIFDPTLHPFLSSYVTPLSLIIVVV